jgi:acylphosphatase
MRTVLVATLAGPKFMPFDRRRVHFSGRVQGVGFRYATQSLARAYQVAGYVRNLPDGRVELLAEGYTDELDAFLASIRAEMDAYITNVTTELQPPGDPPLFGFSVRH